MIPKLITPPAVEPVSLEDAYIQCRVQAYDSSGHPDDTLLEALIVAAREHAEGFTGLSMAEQEFEIALDAFPTDEIKLPMAPLVRISSITYVVDGAPQTLSSDAYAIDTYQRPGWVFPASASSWPAADSVVNAVKIRYVAGFGVDQVLPKSIVSAMKLLIAHWYEHREEGSSVKLESIPLGVERILRPHRILMGMA